MKVGTAITLQAFTKTLKELWNKHPGITVGHTLEALEHLRYSMTEAAIARAYPELRPKKRAPHELRPKQKRPPHEDLDRTI